MRGTHNGGSGPLARKKTSTKPRSRKRNSSVKTKPKKRSTRAPQKKQAKRSTRAPQKKPAKRSTRVPQKKPAKRSTRTSQKKPLRVTPRMRAAFKHVPETRARTSRSELTKQLVDAVTQQTGSASTVIWWKVKSLNARQLQFLVDEIDDAVEPDDAFIDHDIAIHTDLVYTRKK